MSSQSVCSYLRFYINIVLLKRYSSNLINKIWVCFPKQWIKLSSILFNQLMIGSISLFYVSLWLLFIPLIFIISYFYFIFSKCCFPSFLLVCLSYMLIYKACFYLLYVLFLSPFEVWKWSCSVVSDSLRPRGP